MRLSQKVLKRRFKEFNEKYFNGYLVEPKFEITGSKWVAGMFLSTVHLGKDELGEEYAKELCNIRIKLSKYLIKNSNILNNILLHEMIHYFGYYMNTDIDGTHGDFFMSMAKEINKDGFSVQQYYEEN